MSKRGPRFQKKARMDEWIKEISDTTFLTGNCEAHIIWENARFERIASILRVII